MKTNIIIFIIILAFVHHVFTQNCPGAAFFNGQRCAPCATNCQCTTENACSSCLPGYTYDARFQNCLQCPGFADTVNIGCKECCYQVKGPAFVCSSCPTGNYIFHQGGQCLQVMGCLSLSTQGICLACASGYFLSQGACVQCDASCATCDHSSLCLTCNTGYYNQTDVSFALCQACPVGCSACASGGTCSACNSGYRLNGGSCTACGANCDQCGAGSCITCSSGAVMISGACYVCTDLTQQGSTGCTSCTSSGTRVECSACAAGYYLDPATKACATCASKFVNSVLCNYDKPLQCSNDADPTLTSRYYLINNQCVQNTNRCKDMANAAGQCSSCYFSALEGYYSLLSGACTLCNVVGCASYSTTCQCLSCQNGYQFINNQCIACQSLHCNRCQTSVTACETCAVAYGRLSSACQLCQPANCNNCDGDSSVCAQCNTGFYLSGGQCYNCQANCDSCLSSTQCNVCANGYYRQTNGRCKALPSNCVSIDNATLNSNVGACKRCRYGYILLDGNCYPCGLSLFNLQLCSDRHCPDYYIQLTHEPFLAFVLSILLFMVFTL